MDVLARLLTGTLHAHTPGPADDWWYGPVGTYTQSGLRVDEEGAKKVSAWFRGRDILATTLAMLPLGIYQRLPNDEGREAAPNHPLHDVIHRKPNTWQDSFQWRRQAMYHLIDHGNAYSGIVPGRRGFVEQLWPIDPKLVTPALLPSGRKVFHIRDPKTGQTTTSTQDEIFHLCGASEDGIAGKGILQYARDAIGLGMALDSYAARLFSQGSLHGGTITVPGVLNEEASKRMAKSFVTSQSTWHMPKVLEQGATYAESTLTPEDSQFILSRKFTVNDLARWLGLPPHMLADLERSTNNNIEWQGQEFVTYSEGQWLALWEFGINDQLIIRVDTFYSEFTRDALVRGDTAARWEAYMKAITSGVFTRNEVRVMENKRKLPGLDTPLDPANITGKQPAAADKTPEPKKAAPSDDEADDQARAIVVEAAAQLLRKEIKAMQQRAVKFAADQDAFADAVTTFYQQHQALVAQRLQMAETEAASYCAGQAHAVITHGIAIVEQWTTRHYAEGLASWALDAEEQAA